MSAYDVIKQQQIKRKEILVYDIQYNLNMGEKNKGNKRRLYCLKAIELSILFLRDFECNLLLLKVLKNKIDECLKEEILDWSKVKLNKYKKEVEEIEEGLSVLR